MGIITSFWHIARKKAPLLAEPSVLLVMTPLVELPVKYSHADHGVVLVVDIVLIA